MSHRVLQSAMKYNALRQADAHHHFQSRDEEIQLPQQGVTEGQCSLLGPKEAKSDKRTGTTAETIELKITSDLDFCDILNDIDKWPNFPDNTIELPRLKLVDADNDINTYAESKRALNSLQQNIIFKTFVAPKLMSTKIKHTKSKSKRAKKFEKIELKSIISTFNFSFSHHCFFVLNYDLRIFNNRLKLANRIYNAKGFPGVKFISFDIREFNGYRSMYFFTEPVEDQHFILYVGQAVVFKMKYVKELCNYSDTVYCSQLNTGLIYTIPYHEINS